MNYVVRFGRKILYPGVFQLLDQSKEDNFIFRYFDWLSVFFLKLIYPGVRRPLLVFFIVLHFKILAVERHSDQALWLLCSCAYLPAFMLPVFL